MDPRNGGDLLCSQEGVYSVPRRGRREGGAGYGCCPIELGKVSYIERNTGAGAGNREQSSSRPDSLT